MSVIVLFGSGVGASVLHLPTLASLWQTSYGQAIIVKASLLGCAILVASGNLLRTVPRSSSSAPPMSAAILLRRLVSVEVLLVAAADRGRRRALEPAAAAEGARVDRRGERAHGPRPRDAGRDARTATSSSST